MTTIIVTHEDNEIDEFEFDSTDQVISIGRRSTNHVCIPNLSVSGVHARITIDGDSALIEDNNSTNGTYINGRLISRQLLNANDEIVIGKTRVIVQLNDSVQDNPPTLNAVQNVAPIATPYANNAADNLPASADYETSANAANSVSAENDFDSQNHFNTDFDDGDDSYIGEPSKARNQDRFDDRPMTLSEKAKLALGRDNAPSRPGLKSVAAAGLAATSASAAANRAFANDSNTAVAEAPVAAPVQAESEHAPSAHPLDGLDESVSEVVSEPVTADQSFIDNDISTTTVKPAGAVIEIQNGAKSGQVLPIDKPVTTLGRPGIQIAAIMRKPDGYFLMHIESDDSVDMPTLNQDTIGDDPVMLCSGDRLNVAGIDVEFMLS